MRLYNPSSCTPVVMKGLPSKWRSQHHFLPLLDTVPIRSAQSDRDGIFRRTKAKLKIRGFYLPEVIQSSTSTTASTSPQKNKTSGSEEPSEGDETISFSDLPQRQSYEVFHFDLETSPENAVYQKEERACEECSSSSTVSSKSFPLHGDNIELLSFEDFTGDEFEDAQPNRQNLEQSPFIVCKSNRRRVVTENEVGQEFSSVPTSQDITFPPIEKLTKPPLLPLVVASPVAVCETTEDREIPKVAAPSIRGQEIKGNDDAGHNQDSSREAVEDDSKELSAEGTLLQEKYRRMLKVGLPIGAVRLEMAKDGVSAKKKSHAAINKTDVQRFRIHWDSFQPVLKSSAPSLWSHIRTDNKWLGELEVDPKEMKTLFEREQTSTTMSANRPKEQSLFRVIEPKRANNCAIFLASIDMTSREIAEAIDGLNHEVFNPDQIDDLAKFLPTTKEAEVLKANLKANHKSRYREGESFMIEMIRIEDAKTKLEIMSAIKRFPLVYKAVTTRKCHRQLCCFSSYQHRGCDFEDCLRRDHTIIWASQDDCSRSTPWQSRE